MGKQPDYNKNMPQLTPFYYMNEIVFAFTVIVLVLYILSKYILPRIVRLFISRMFIEKI
uniref:ATP synthase protein 8 n=2 Tax=Ophiocordycipitaceae sp. TaxID=1907519 RepID=A0A7S8CTV7_9HYPO|nr:ATP synthase F0 subunit 8 [Ophiocordycipitaceae sp.]QUT09506.1 ATP synthase F0 subunit 8 [Ophiocordycipitaceae sp.]QUT09534.1 ATP synthase F0 subunit 8 [Ophiocordycipitaceae sp.]QUT13264.1 ATP synthase F0 subunit 8 [Ophiocordycipitaceae sp.]DAJ12183.1 TPA_asm: ATP synthase F0 subunit 8 [Ophiocordycipitaceae sp.]